MSRKPSTSNYKKLARRMRTSSVGNVTTASARGARRGANARYARPSSRGEIHQVLTQPTARETLASYDPRRKRSYVERNVAASRRRNMALVVVLAVIVAVFACVVGVFVYLGSIDAKLALSDGTVKAALAADSGEENTTYTLLTADFDGDETAPDAFVVLRTNTQENNAYAISIPANLQVEGSDGQQTTLGALRAASGDGAIVSTVDSLLGVKISHYATLSSSNFVSLVDALGGIEVTLDQTISDAQAGSFSLASGTQTLSGEQALFVCRANDFAKDAEYARGTNIAKVACALLQKAQTLPSGIGFFTTMDSLAEYASCDMGVRDAGALLDALRNVSAESMYAASLPLENTAEDDVLQASTANVATMMSQIRAGGSPVVESHATVDSATAASLTVSVYNGGDVVGAATEAAETLSGLGFNVVETGNTTMQVYDETLVIYADASSATAAQAMVDALGVGRALQDTVHYSFSTDIYVVVGKDWRTVLAATGRTVDDDGYIVTIEEYNAALKAKEAAAAQSASSDASSDASSTSSDGAASASAASGSTTSASAS